MRFFDKSSISMALELYGLPMSSNYLSYFEADVDYYYGKVRKKFMLGIGDFGTVIIREFTDTNFYSKLYHVMPYYKGEYAVVEIPPNPILQGRILGGSGWPVEGIMVHDRHDVAFIISGIVKYHQIRVQKEEAERIEIKRKRSKEARQAVINKGTGFFRNIIHRAADITQEIMDDGLQ